jgi:hypothetical protein
MTGAMYSQANTAGRTEKSTPAKPPAPTRTDRPLDTETASDRWLWPHDVSAMFTSAGLYEVSSKALRRWAAAGKISATRTPGGHRRYRESDAQALLTELRSAA